MGIDIEGHLAKKEDKNTIFFHIMVTHHRRCNHKELEINGPSCQRKWELREKVELTLRSCMLMPSHGSLLRMVQSPTLWKS